VKKTFWILFCIDSAGPASAPYAVEIAAQRMRGWKREGVPFHRLVKPREGAQPGTSALFEHSLESLEIDGLPGTEVHRELLLYAGNVPWVAHELDTAWVVLRGDWQSLKMTAPSARGFCMARLIQRLLDPLPATHCKIDTLRQFYQLPERAPRSALSQVETLADLLETVLRPLAETCDLITWQDVVGFTLEPWFPSRITFGTFKGRLFQEALKDAVFAQWLERLAASSNPQSAAMGAWYLERLQSTPPDPATSRKTGAESSKLLTVKESYRSSATSTQLAEFSDPEIERLNALVAKAQARLAELQAAYTIDKGAVETTQSILFGILRPYFQKRDKLSLVVRYRRKFLDALLRGGEEAAEKIVKESEEALKDTDAQYEQTAMALAERKTLSQEDEEELKRLWRKLVGLFHPDRFASQPDKLEAYAKLTQEINDAKDKGDIERLREIALDPAGYMAKMGLSHLNFAHEQELAGLRKLLNSLETLILATLQALEALREDPAYELHQLNAKRPGFIQEAGKDQATAIEAEVESLEEEAAQLKNEITELTGALAPEI